MMKFSFRKFKIISHFVITLDSNLFKAMIGTKMPWRSLKQITQKRKAEFNNF